MLLHHVSVGVKDVAAAGRFYDAILGALGYVRVMDYSPGAIGYGAPDGQPEFWIGQPYDQRGAKAGNGVHVAFAAGSIADTHAFHKAALTHGASDDGAPGLRPDYGHDYYGCFVRDPDGNKVEAVLRHGPRVARAKLPAAAKAKKTKAKTKAKAKSARKTPAKKPKAKAAVKKPAKKTKKAKARKR